MKLMKLTLIILIVLLLNIVILIGGAYGVLEGNIEWTDPQEKTLSLAEYFTRDNFIIEAMDFYNSDHDPTVLITVYGDAKDPCICSSRIVSQVIGRKGDSWNVTDRANITVMNITIIDLKNINGNISAGEGLNVIVDQRVKIRTMLVGQPAPILSIQPKERQQNNRTSVNRIFYPGSEISINFSITNEGKATLRQMHLIANTSLPLLFPSDSLDRELPDLIANDTASDTVNDTVNNKDVVNIRFIAPFVERRKNFIISGRVVGKDAFGREFNVTDSTYITVRSLVENIIGVQEFVSEKIYMGDFAYVSLYVNNNGFENMTVVNVTEDIPTAFEPVYNNDTNLTNFTLRPLESKLILYKLKPKRPGIYVFPANSSIVEWKERSGDGEVEGIEYNNKSNRLIVSGPYVVLTKSGIVKRDNIEIKIDARNSGDRTAIVRIIDPIPKGVVMQSLVVHPNSLRSFSYTINKSNLTGLISNGKVILPHTDGVVLDQFLYSNDKYNQRIISNALVLDLSN
jgi:hypothetical protein